MKTELRILSLVERINHLNRRYYLEAISEVSDYEYDMLLAELKTLEEENPQFLDPNSPTQRVGGQVADSFTTKPHSIPMLSLDNTYSAAELIEFQQRLKRLLPANIGELDYVIEPKIDGIGISIRYENGKLSSALTRGNGVEGDDVTENIKTIKNLPLQLAADAPAVLEVRGEVYMPNSAFKLLNSRRIKVGKPAFANPRNATAGSVKLLDSGEVSRRPLAIWFYAMGESSEKFSNQNHFLDYIKSLGFAVSPLITTAHGIDEAIAAVDRLEAEKSNIDYDIDGAVIKINEWRLYEQLGYTSKSPRWAIAYKYAAEKAITKLNAITIQVGRTGVLTPVAELEPVFLSGSTVSRATLHNFEELERKDVRVNDFVEIEKAGEIIPAVIRVITSKRQPDSQPFLVPKSCPECSSQLIKNSGETAIRCSNSQCPAIIRTSLTHFVAKGAMDIDSLGSALIELLVDNNFINSPADIYELTTQQKVQLMQFDGLGEKSINKLNKSIEVSKSQPAWRLLFGLGIRHVGAKVAQDLMDNFGSITTIAATAEKDLLANLTKFVNSGLKTPLTDPSASELLKSYSEVLKRKTSSREFLAKLSLENRQEYPEDAAEAIRQIVAKKFPQALFFYKKIAGIDQAVFGSIMDFFSVEGNCQLLARLKNAGLKLTQEERTTESSIFNDKTCVITGTMHQMGRREAAEKLKTLGANVSSSISKKTDFLIAGEKAGSKLKKAESLGVRVLSETEFLELLSEPAEATKEIVAEKKPTVTESKEKSPLRQDLLF